MLREPNSFASDLGYRIDSRFGGAVNRRVRRGHGTGSRADIYDAAACGAEMFDRLLRSEDQTKDINVELLVEVLFRDPFERGKLVNAGIVYQDIDFAKGLLRFRKETLDVGLLGHVRLHGNGPSTVLFNLGDDAVSTLIARGVVDDNGRALGGHMFGDRRADSLGCAADDCNFPFKFLHCLYSYL